MSINEMASTATRMVGFMLLIGIIACSSSQPIRETLDPLTSATITSNGKALDFYRDSTSQATDARYFLQLGPIAVNIGGRYRYYLWISNWSTARYSEVSERRDRLQSIVIFADAEPINLELAGWTPAAIETSESIYEKPVASAVEAYYEVTIDQIRQIVNADSVRISTGPPHDDIYETWDDQRSALDGIRAFYNHLVF